MSIASHRLCVVSSACAVFARAQSMRVLILFTQNEYNVGREPVINQLLSHLDRMKKTGNGSVVLITGAIGMGKTHVLQHITRQAREKASAYYSCGFSQCVSIFT